MMRPPIFEIVIRILAIGAAVRDRPDRFSKDPYSSPISVDNPVHIAAHYVISNHLFNILHPLLLF
jgi:hypothetical protein